MMPQEEELTSMRISLIVTARIKSDFSEKVTQRVNALPWMCNTFDLKCETKIKPEFSMQSTFVTYDADRKFSLEWWVLLHHIYKIKISMVRRWLG